MKKKLPFIIGGIVILLFVILGVIYYLYQFTEVFGKKVIPLKVDSIQIQYVPGIDYNTIYSMNEKETVIDVQSISLSKSELQSLKKSLSKIHENSVKTKNITIEHYQLIINDKIVLQVGDGIGTILEGDKTTDVIIPREFSDEIQSIIDKNNKKVIKKLTSETVTLKLEGASITLKDKDNLAYVKDLLSYYPISLNADYKSYQNGYKIEMILDNGTKIYLYESGIGYIVQKNGEETTSTFAIFIDDLYGLIEKIYKKSTE